MSMNRPRAADCERVPANMGIRVMRFYCVLLLLAILPTTSWSGEIHLTVSEPSHIARHHWPVTSGVPLEQGALRDPSRAALFDEAGNEMPLQTEALAKWPDGSIRWLLLDFSVDLQAGATTRPVLRYGKTIRRAAASSPLEVIESNSGATLLTGPLKIE